MRQHEARLLRAVQIIAPGCAAATKLTTMKKAGLKTRLYGPAEDCSAGSSDPASQISSRGRFQAPEPVP